MINKEIGVHVIGRTRGIICYLKQFWKTHSVTNTNVGSPYVRRFTEKQASRPVLEVRFHLDIDRVNAVVLLLSFLS